MDMVGNVGTVVGRGEIILFHHFILSTLILFHLILYSSHIFHLILSPFTLFHLYRYYIGIYSKLVYIQDLSYNHTPMIIYELQANTVRHTLGVF